MPESNKLRQQYYELLPKLTQVMQIVTNILKPLNDCIIETNFKPFSSVIRKMSVRHLNNMLDLSDLVRGRLFFPVSRTHAEIIRELSELFKKYIKDIDWKSMTNHGLQYEGVIHFDLNIDGINFELQVMPIEFKPYKEKLHQVYDLLRTNNSLSDKQKNRLKKLHNTTYRILNEMAFKNRNIIP